MTPKDLNPEQKLAVYAPKEPLLIVAGAGTGKTKTLTGRLSYLIESGVTPSQILAITFTNKAAKEMAKRVGPTGAWIGTFHSLGAWILRSECRALGRTPNFAIFDDQDSFQLVKRIVKDLKVPQKRRVPSAFRDFSSYLKNGSAQRGMALASQMPGEFRRFFEEYEAGLIKNNAFDFDDLIEKVVRLFKENPATLAKYQKRFSHILVDEYQDLNNIQYELVRLLAGKAQSLTVVGDDQQTIYSWRGSNFEIFLNFENDWPKASVILLEQNYRSTKNIISAASAVISHNERQKPKRLWTENPEGTPVRLGETAHEDDEAQWIVNRILEDPLKPTAVLYRTNAQSRALEQALLSAKIPYRIFGGVRFYDRREIKDALSVLRLANNPSDSISAERLEKAFGKGRGRELKELFVSRGEESPLELISLFLEKADYLSYLEKNTSNPSERMENLAELSYAASSFKNLSLFLEQVSLVQATDPQKESLKPAVELMTIHLAKGLEFDRVFVAGVNEGILPHNRSLSKEEELEEERRLMYVAMTRARQELYLSFYDIPSRFLSEIPSDLLEFEAGENLPSHNLEDEERYIRLD